LGKFADERLVVLCRYQTRKNFDPASLNSDVVITASKLDPAHFFDAQPTALGAIIQRELLQGDYTVRDAVEMKIAFVRGQIIEQKNSTSPPNEEVLQSEYLPSIAQRVLSQQTHLREAVKNHPQRLNLGYAVENQLRGFAELQLCWVKQSLLPLRIETSLGGNQFKYGELIDGPAVSLGDKLKLGFALR
jgi:hypothetical protein